MIIGACLRSRLVTEQLAFAKGLLEDRITLPPRQYFARRPRIEAEAALAARQLVRHCQAQSRGHMPQIPFQRLVADELVHHGRAANRVILETAIFAAIDHAAEEL